MSYIVLIAGHKQSYPHRDDQSTMKRRKIDNDRNITESKKYGCVCTCCHRNDTSQSTTLTNYCLCTCCHKTEIPRLQCIIFKESKYNYDNTIIVEALSHRFSVPTSQEYICKKCDKDLLQEIMPMNSVASRI